jgi:anti-sigma regulatory factor (Ser/Thr protein kinase)
MMESPVVIQIDDSSRVAEVRRVVLQTAEREGFDGDLASSAAIVATELATNLSRHAQRGELHIHGLSSRGLAGLEIISIDQGPGMSNVQQCLADGYSTAGTSGTGLGAIQRLSTQLDVHSAPGKGTVLAARLLAAGRTERPPLCLGVTAKPVAGETVSGDAWAARFGNKFALLIVADGLGHGVQAFEASSEAVRCFLKYSDESPVELLTRIHGALRGTRGAAVSIAKIEFDQRRILFAGIGNVAGVIMGSDAAGATKTQSMISHNGTAGHEVRQMKEFLYPFKAQDTIVMHSDGLSSHWNLQAYPGILQKHVSVVAGTLYRDSARLRDDVCVLVGRTP